MRSSFSFAAARSASLAVGLDLHLGEFHLAGDRHLDGAAASRCLIFFGFQLSGYRFHVVLELLRLTRELLDIVGATVAVALG